MILDEVSTATFPATESCLKYRSDLELQRVPCRTVENPSWDLKRPRRSTGDLLVFAPDAH